jgi:cytochrome c biogenesis protein CcmG, thiol:disulfide interchange protein DsbE
MPRFLLSILCFVALVSVAAGCGGDDPQSEAPSPEVVRKALKGSPPALAAVHAQANELLDGGPDALKKRLAELKGHPVVVNKWAAWCGPCRAEFPYFQSQALKHGKRIAFLGVDAADNYDDARELLEQFPVTYPSYKDPRQNVSAVFNGTVATPVTAFYDSKGEIAYTHQGAYLDEQDLADDIRRYAR